MGIVEIADYGAIRLVLKRGIAAIYFIAFLVTARQFVPLAGEDGLLPLDEFVNTTSLREAPSIFHFWPSDVAIRLGAWMGVGLSVIAFLGFPDRFGTLPTIGVWLLLWLLYLSFVNAGQLFYSFGWESMLLESGFLAIFLGAAGTATPDIVIWLFRWVLFRMMFGSGLIKLRGDRCWHDLSCLNYHYETQPMPNPVSWYAHHLPGWVHRLGVIGNHGVELVLPWLFFAPQPFAMGAGVLTIGFQGWLIVTGNFSWWNWLTALVAVSTFDPTLVTEITPFHVDVTTPTPAYLTVLVLILCVVVFILSIPIVVNLLSPRQRMNTSFEPLRLVNTYGAFGSITKTRYQLVIEGTQADNPDEDDWLAYEFKGQPVRLDEAPPQWAPYHLRLDWQLWFAAMQPRPGPRQQWLLSFVQSLLEGDQDALHLLQSNPFRDDPPQFVRIQRYRYQFTTPDERNQSGRWWAREYVGPYLPPVTLNNLQSNISGGLVNQF